MSWTLTHRFIDASGSPSEGEVFVGASRSPVLAGRETVVATGRSVKIGRNGSWTCGDLPSSPADLQIILYPRIKGAGDLGSVVIPAQPDGVTRDLGHLISGWPVKSEVLTPEQVKAVYDRLAALEAAPIGDLSQLQAAQTDTAAAVANLILRVMALEKSGTGGSTLPADVVLVDNGDGTGVLTLSTNASLVDNGDGTGALALPMNSTLVDNGDGTGTLTIL